MVVETSHVVDGVIPEKRRVPREMVPSIAKVAQRYGVPMESMEPFEEPGWLQERNRRGAHQSTIFLGLTSYDHEGTATSILSAKQNKSFWREVVFFEQYPG